MIGQIRVQELLVFTEVVNLRQREAQPDELQ